MYIYYIYIYIYYIYYIYIHATQSAEILQKQDEYNTYVIICRLSPKWPCGNSSTWAHNACDIQNFFMKRLSLNGVP